jgi:hypothetical protein
VQIYEPIMGDTEGKVTYTLLRAAVYLKDNRLLPSGADKTTLPADIGVSGEAAEDDNFAGGGDRVTYRVEVGRGTGPFSVTVELLYQPLSYRFLQDLTTEGEAGQALGRILATADHTPQRVGAVLEAAVK